MLAVVQDQEPPTAFLEFREWKPPLRSRIFLHGPPGDEPGGPADTPGIWRARAASPMLLLAERSQRSASFNTSRDQVCRVIYESCQPHMCLSAGMCVWCVSSVFFPPPSRLAEKKQCWQMMPVCLFPLLSSPSLFLPVFVYPSFTLSLFLSLSIPLVPPSCLVRQLYSLYCPPPLQNPISSSLSISPSLPPTLTPLISLLPSEKCNLLTAQLSDE